MRPATRLVLAAALIAASSVSGYAKPIELAGYQTPILNLLDAQRDGVMGIGAVKVNKVTADAATKTIAIDCNEAAAYLPIDVAELAVLKDHILGVLPATYADYNVTLTAGGHTFDELAMGAQRTYTQRQKPTQFVKREQAEAAPNGLDGANIALWQSHGWYFEPKLNRWEWQRARIFQTVEDLYTQSYVMPFLMPMLENAGAYVMSPRERDTNVVEIIVDGDGGLATGRYHEHNGKESWSNTGVPGFAYKKAALRNGDNPFKDGNARQAKTVGAGQHASKATYSADIPADGRYAVYVSYQSLPNSATDAKYTVHSLNGDLDYTVNQTMGGGTWIYLGHFDFKKGHQEIVELSNVSATPGTVVTADAVKIGGGMGNVERIVKEPIDPEIDYKYVGSGYPRFVEGSRYWLQWAGAPDSVFTESNYVNDYGDDYKSRGLWVNWLLGGSEAWPDREGLNIPVDLSFAFHTDAGTTRNDSIIGTLGIYCTAGDTLGNGDSRMLSRDFTNLVMTNIVDDIRAKYEPNWTRRGMWDKSYYEARVPRVPSMLLELLSHQNFADMKYGLDPNFRFDVSRAIYKGMLQFLAQRDGREYVVTPLAPQAFAIHNGDNGRYTLSWQMQPDSLEATAVPDFYIIEERVGDGAFQRLAKTSDTNYTVTVNDDKIHSYRIIAGNSGGVSFPSEALALRHGGKGQVLIVNGFTRVSAPDWFEAGDIAGFYDQRDHGVPYIEDISFIGSQFEYRRDIPWYDDDSAGFGASRSDYEDKVLPGNTFDFVYVHGQAVANAGYGFISASAMAYEQGAYAQAAPAVIDLILGKQKEVASGRGVYGTKYKTFNAAMQQQLSQHCQQGGAVLVTGAFVATDLWDNPFSTKEQRDSDLKFAADILGYKWRVGQACVEGGAYEVDSRFKAFDGLTFEFNQSIADAGVYGVDSPDSFYSADPKTGATIMRYTENNLVAATAMDNGTWRTVVVGFPFETITKAENRDKLMQQALTFFAQPKAVKKADDKATKNKKAKKAKKNKKSKK